MESRIRGTVFCLLWYLSILSGFYLLYCPLLPLLIISPKHYRNFTEILFVMWETYPVALLEIIFGTKVVIVGDSINPDDRALIIMNHRTRLDWNFLWSAMFHGSRPPSHRLKFVLKSSLRHFPGLGWIMQMTSFFYIHRSWQSDQKLMRATLDYFKDINHRCQILLFPEGTDMSQDSRRSSDRFAVANSLPKYEFVLHPRTKGFTFLMQSLRTNNQLDAVYDISVGYPGIVPQTELHMLKGQIPKQIHFKIKRHPASTLPLEEIDLDSWLNTTWSEKNQTLQDFYIDSQFDSTLPIVYKQLENTNITNTLHLSFVAWTGLTFFAIYAVCHIFSIQMWMLGNTLFFITLSFICDGLQHIEISLFYKYNSITNNNDGQK